MFPFICRIKSVVTSNCLVVKNYTGIQCNCTGKPGGAWNKCTCNACSNVSQKFHDYYTIMINRLLLLDAYATAELLEVKSIVLLEITFWGGKLIIFHSRLTK